MNESKMCYLDEAFTQEEMLEEIGYCKECYVTHCTNCGKENTDEQTT